MTAAEFKSWKELQLVGIDTIERISPVSASHVRLGVALGEAIQNGLADESDYAHFEAWHAVVSALPEFKPVKRGRAQIEEPAE